MSSLTFWYYLPGVDQDGGRKTLFQNNLVLVRVNKYKDTDERAMLPCQLIDTIFVIPGVRIF